MSDKGRNDSLWSSLVEGLVASLGSQLLQTPERNPADPVSRMEPVREDRRQAGEEAIFRATEGARGTAPMERVIRERRYVARAMAERQAAGAVATRKGAQAPAAHAPTSWLKALVTAANGALKTLGVPEMNLAVGGGIECQFSGKTWTMTVPGAFFATTPNECMMALAASCYHESRHAEQYFNLARMLAGQGKTVPEIAAACQGMDPGKVQLARGNPIPPSDPRAALYQRMLDNLNDPDSRQLADEIRDQTGPVEAAAVAWQQALQALSPDEPGLRAGFEALMVTFKPLMQRFQALEVEADALAIEERVKGLFT